MISKEDVRQLLIDRRLFAAFSEDVDDESELHFDSVSILWFLQGISDRFGVEVTLEEGDVEHFTSVERITVWLRARMQRSDRAQ